MVEKDPGVRSCLIKVYCSMSNFASKYFIMRWVEMISLILSSILNFLHLITLTITVILFIPVIITIIIFFLARSISNNNNNN